MDLDGQFHQPGPIARDQRHAAVRLPASLRPRHDANVPKAIHEAPGGAATVLHAEIGGSKLNRGGAAPNSSLVFLQIDSGGPHARLNVFVGNILSENRIPPPHGVLAPNFW